MFRTLAFVAVRQQQHESAQAIPLRFAGADELIDDDLRAVGEIAELPFPQRERVRIGRRITVLERHHRFFGQQRIDHGDVRVFAHGRQRQIRRAAVLIVQHGVAMEERAAAGILADQTQIETLIDQRGVGEVLGETPVHRLFAGGHLVAVFVDLRDARMHGDIRRDIEDRFAECGELVGGDTGLHRLIELGADVFGPVDGEGVFDVGVDVGDRRASVELGAIRIDHRLRVVVGNHVFRGQTLRIQFAYRRTRADDLIHQRLRRGRFIGFVVALAAIADQIDHHIALELQAIVEGETRAEHARRPDRRRSRAARGR